MDRDPISWASVRLNTDRTEFDDGCLRSDVQSRGDFEISRDGLSRIECKRQLVRIINQGRLGLLTAECAMRGFGAEYVYRSVHNWVAYAERHEKGRGFGSHPFWHGLQTTLESDAIIGCCPLVAPLSFPYASWDGTSPEWGCQLRRSRPKYDLLCSPKEEQRIFCRQMA